MVIQLPEWNGWRVSGSGTDWQIQVIRKRTTREDTWEGTNFYSSLANALEAAFEKTLRESGEKVDDLRKLAREIRRAKEEIAKAAGK